MMDRAVILFRTRQANCALSVARAWCETTQQDGVAFEHFSGYGHGSSPDGTCGALYAAKLIAGPEAAPKVEASFTQASGGFTKCREIRSNRAMPCAQCVGTAAKALSEQMPPAPAPLPDAGALPVNQN